MRLQRFLAAFLLLAGLHAVPHAARAAEGYDNCTGYVDTAPATITTQGVWCLRHDLSTNMASGDAITVGANNVTIDCNGFKIGGLDAGSTTQAQGIATRSPRQNITVRNCNVRGYQTGIALDGSGHLVEDNRLDKNLFAGIRVDGDHNMVRRNRVYDTGSDRNVNIVGISASADIVDNIVDGVFSTVDSIATHTIIGIDARGAGAQVERNRVGGLQPYAGDGRAFGIVADESYMTASGNSVAAMALATGGTGIVGQHDNVVTTVVTFCSGNTIANFATAVSDCSSAGGANFQL